MTLFPEIYAHGWAWHDCALLNRPSYLISQRDSNPSPPSYLQTPSLLQLHLSLHVQQWIKTLKPVGNLLTSNSKLLTVEKHLMSPLTRPPLPTLPLEPAGQSLWFVTLSTTSDG